MSDRVSKFIFCASVVLIGLVAAFGYGALAHRDNRFPVPQLRLALDFLRGDTAFIGEDGAALHLQPARGQGAGVMTGADLADDKLVFLSGFFDNENQARLVRRDGSVVQKWSLDYARIFPDAQACDPQTPLFVDVHGTHVTAQGEVIFNFEYCGTAKIDQCSRPIWTIDDETHHSVIAAEAGGYWILGRETWPTRGNERRFPPFSEAGIADLIQEDTLMRVAEDGTVLEQISIPAMMMAGGLEGVLTGTAQSFKPRFARQSTLELVHSNKAAELTRDRADAFPLFSAGDIAISMRNLNLVMVFDPVTQEIKWHQTGPWLRQHDPEFRTDGRISIFNNNAYYTSYVRDQTDLSRPRVTNIMAIDPVTRKTEIVYESDMLSVIRGQHELLETGNILITEFDAGRVLEVDPQGNVVWEYVNAYNEQFVGEIMNSAVFPANFFETDFAGCN